MLYWAMQYGNHVEVLEPAGLREKVRETIEGMRVKYSGKDVI